MLTGLVNWAGLNEPISVRYSGATFATESSGPPTVGSSVGTKGQMIALDLLSGRKVSDLNPARRKQGGVLVASLSSSPHQCWAGDAIFFCFMYSFSMGFCSGLALRFIYVSTTLGRLAESLVVISHCQFVYENKALWGGPLEKDVVGIIDPKLMP